MKGVFGGMNIDLTPKASSEKPVQRSNIEMDTDHHVTGITRQFYRQEAAEAHS